MVVAHLVSLAFVSGSEPPLVFVDGKVENCRDTVRYEETNVIGNARVTAQIRRNLEYRYSAGTDGWFNVEIKETWRKFEITSFGGDGKASGTKVGPIQQCKLDALKYVDKLPKKLVVDRWGNACIQFADPDKYPFAFLSCSFPRDRKSDQLVWFSNVRLPFGYGEISVSPFPLKYKLSPRGVKLGAGEVYDALEFLCEANVEPPFQDRDPFCFYRFDGACWIDPKTKAIAAGFANYYWSIAERKQDGIPINGRQLRIYHAAEMGEKWVID